MIHRIVNIPESQSFFLFGPRGSGKSTWLKQYFKNEKVTWLDLLNLSLELQLTQNPDALLSLWQKNKSEWVVIDEIQKIPSILDVVHKGIEEYKIKFALTGSSARKLKRGGSNLLAGRAVERFLSPFSSLELQEQFDLQKALEFGLLPALWDNKWNRTEMSDFLYSYVNTYLKEEIAAEQLVRNLAPFRRLLLSAAQSNGKIINHSAIERDSGVARKQSERHFEILVDTLMGRFLEPFDTSIRKRQSLKSKFFFFDSGIVRALHNLAGEQLHPSTFEYGDLFETFLTNEFFKLEASFKKRWRFFYYRTQHDKEIDLIIEKPRGKLILVEIKSFTKFNIDKVQSFFTLAKALEHEAAYILSNDRSGQEINNVRCLHWKEGLKEIFEY